MTASLVSYLADPTDPSYGTPEVDLNAFEAGLGIFETDADSLDLGAPDLDAVWLNEAGKDDDVLSASRRGRVEASFNLRIGPRSVGLDNITTGMRRLNAALGRSGVWVLQQPGASDRLLIDYYPSPLVQQLQPGERSMFHLWTQLQQPNGMRVVILRHPKMRTAALSADVQLAHNVTFAEDHDGDGIPSLWTWSDLGALASAGYDWTYGAHLVQIASGGGAVWISQAADAGVITAGTTYTFAADVAAAYPVAPTVRARIDWLDGGGAVIGSSVYGSAVGILLGPRFAFSRPALVGAVAPAGAVGARYGVEVAPASAATVSLWIRDAQFEVGVAANPFRVGFETVTQTPGQPFYKRIWAKTSGNADAVANLRATPAAGHPTAAMTYARRSGARDSALSMTYPVTGWAAAASTALLGGTTSVTDAGRSVAKTALTNDILKSVLREEGLQAEESALRGTWRLRAALRGEVGDAYQIDAIYGIGDVTDLPYTTVAAPRRLDLTTLTSSAYYVVDLGLVTVPPIAPGLFLEVRALRESGGGTGQIYVDQVWLEPADDDLYASAEVPGLHMPGPVSASTKGSSLTTPPGGLANDPGSGNPFVAGSVYNDDLLLNDSWEAAGLPVLATAALTPGVEHTFTTRVNMYTAAEKQARVHGEFRVHNLTDNTQVARAVLKNIAGAAWSRVNYTLRFTPAAGKAYLVYVVQTVPQATGNIHVMRISHSFVAPVDGSTDTIAVDGDQRLAYILAGADIKAPLALTPPFLSLMPGAQLIRVSFAGLGPNGSDVALDDGPIAAHDAALSARVGVHQIPRWFN